MNLWRYILQRWFFSYYLLFLCYKYFNVNIISPQIYRDFLFSYDKKIAENFERFGMHTCNWDITPYLEEIKKLPKVGYLDMGIMFDMKKFKKMFPEASRVVMYPPVRLQEASLNELKKDNADIKVKEWIYIKKVHIFSK